MQTQERRPHAIRGRPIHPLKASDVQPRRVPRRSYEEQLDDYEIRYAKPDRKFEVIPAQEQRFRKPVATVRPLIVKDKPEQPKKARKQRKPAEDSAVKIDEKLKQEKKEKDQQAPEKAEKKSRPAKENEVRISRFHQASYFAYQVRLRLKEHEVVVCSAIGEEAQRKLSHLNMLVGKDSGFCFAIKVDCHVLGESKKAVLRFYYKKGENFQALSEKLDAQFLEKKAKREAEREAKKQEELEKEELEPAEGKEASLAQASPLKEESEEKGLE